MMLGSFYYQMNYKILILLLNYMVDFSLHKYKGGGSTNSYNKPHKYRIAKKSGMDLTYLVWDYSEKKKILEEYIKRMELILNKNEYFHLFNPPTDTKIFLNEIIEAIKFHYPNVIDLSYCFEKNNQYSLTIDNNRSIEELIPLVTINKSHLQRIDFNIKKIFIADDVYSTGRSVDLTSRLITEFVSKELECHVGVILTCI